MEQNNSSELTATISLNFLKTKMNEIEKQEENLKRLKEEYSLFEKEAVEKMRELGVKKLETDNAFFSVEEKYTGKMPTVIQSVQQDLSDKEIQKCIDVLKKHNCTAILNESIVTLLKGFDDNEKKKFKEELLQVEQKTGISNSVRYDVHWNTLRSTLKDLLNNNDISYDDKIEIMLVFNVEINDIIKIKSKI